jgi:ABC-2 type transport system permease protein
MNWNTQAISLYTIVRKDVVRIVRIWAQTLLPSVITSALYFIVFGTMLGSRIGEVGGTDYILFIIPGLVMLNIVTNSYSNTATTFFTSKFFARNIDEILVSPTHPATMVSGFVLGGVARGVLVGLLVTVVASFFAVPSIPHPFYAVLFMVLASLIFSLLGFINGVYAKSFDAIQIVPTFVLTPLVYLGGVFYSTTFLPTYMVWITKINPIFYLVNGFRYGFIGTSDVSMGTSITVLLTLTVISFVVAVVLVRKGLGLKQ